MTDQDEEPSSTSTRVIHNHWDSWVAVTLCSAVVLGANEAANDSSRSSEEKFVLAGTVVTVTIGLAAALASAFIAKRFCSGFMEIFCAFLTLGLWCALLAVIMNPSNDLAQGIKEGSNEVRKVKNGNLYFFSWGAFVAALWVCASIVQEATLWKFSETPKHLVDWYFVLACSVVVVWSASNFYKDYNDDVDCSSAKDDDEETCNRTKYAVALGAFGTIVGIVAVVLLKTKCFPTLFEIITTFVLFALFVVGVAIITFGTGPGTVINNLYFFCWIGLLWCAYLFFGTLHEYKAKKKADAGDGEEEDNKEADDKDIEIEDIDAPVPAAEDVVS